MKAMNKQSGFTLVEIAIVLVIIGLLIGGVLKGQQLANSAKEKRVYTDYKSLQAAVFFYVDKEGGLPGDGNSDGQLAVTEIKEHDVSGTKRGFWLDLRASGIIEGRPDDGDAAKGPFGGDITITENAAKVCFSATKQALKTLKNNRGADVFKKITNSAPSDQVTTDNDDDLPDAGYACFVLR